jgi:uncharacterized protein YdeI (YjbR/CyaY-like superfamily)
MPTTDPRVDAYIAKAQPFARPILERLRRTVHAACPAIEETLKWGVPHFMHHGIVCSMAAFSKHCAFTVWNGDALGAAKTTHEAMGQFGRIASVDDLPPARALRGYIETAAQLNEAGVKARTTKRASKPIEVPGWFSEALAVHPAARDSFERFSPSHRREYLEWLTEAKTEATRARRLATAIEWLSEGKPRNWKYEKSEVKR